MADLSDERIAELVRRGSNGRDADERAVHTALLELQRHRAAKTIDTVGIYLTEQERRHVTNVLNDLEVREQAAIRSREGPEAETYAAEHAALKKLMNLPATAAVAASKERVREVVREAVLEAWPIGLAIPMGFPSGPQEVADETASRAAEQLATAAVDLSEEERSDIDALLGNLAEQRESAISRGLFATADVFRDQHAALAKLLAGVPR